MLRVREQLPWAHANCKTGTASCHWLLGISCRIERLVQEPQVLPTRRPLPPLTYAPPTRLSAGWRPPPAARVHRAGQRGRGRLHRHPAAHRHCGGRWRHLAAVLAQGAPPSPHRGGCRVVLRHACACACRCRWSCTCGVGDVFHCAAGYACSSKQRSAKAPCAPASTCIVPPRTHAAGVSQPLWGCGAGGPAGCDRHGQGARAAAMFV